MRALLILLCSLPAWMVQAETFDARVIVVMDGDTVMAMRGGRKLKIRLANIDAPEKAQPYGPESRQSLYEMVNKREVQIDSQAVDQYGRVIGAIHVDGYSVNQEQVRRGMAWEYSYRHSDKTYQRLQSEAQQARRGLWAQANPEPPWQWRKAHPSMPQAATSVQPPHAQPVMLYDIECGKKHRCSEMQSCDEARLYFTRCNAKPLDGNRDGEPCEKLCAGKK